MTQKSLRNVSVFSSVRISLAAQSASHFVASAGSLMACQRAAIRCYLPCPRPPRSTTGRACVGCVASNTRRRSTDGYVMLRKSAVDCWRALVGLSAEKSIVVPLRRSPLNSGRRVNSSILFLSISSSQTYRELFAFQRRQCRDVSPSVQVPLGAPAALFTLGSFTLFVLNVPFRRFPDNPSQRDFLLLR